MSSLRPGAWLLGLATALSSSQAQPIVEMPKNHAFGKATQTIQVDGTNLELITNKIAYYRRLNNFSAENNFELQILQSAKDPKACENTLYTVIKHLARGGNQVMADGTIIAEFPRRYSNVDVHLRDVFERQNSCGNRVVKFSSVDGPAP